MLRAVIVRVGFVALAVSAFGGAVNGTEIDAPRLFQELDANHDGELADSEIADEQRLLFKRLVRTGDDNGDGRLSADEFAAALQPVRAEKPLVEKQGSRLPGADALAVLLAKMDANADGRIEADEVPDAYRRVFEQLLRPGDGDKDGNLSQRELGQAAPRLSIVAQIAATRMGLDIEAELKKIPAEQMMAMDQMDAYARPMDMLADLAQAAELFKRLDANGDAQIAAAEVPEPFGARFEEMLRRGDEDGDQKLSRREFMAITRRLAEFESARPDKAAVRRAHRQLLARFDADDDGQLSVREAPPRLAENFDRADADANGKLDETELTRVAETMARMQTFARERGFGRPAMADDDRPARPFRGDARRNNRRPRPNSN
jgi:Ca2+-binding EF-hand superfamily protein